MPEQAGNGEVCATLDTKTSQVGAASALRDVAPGCPRAQGGQRKCNPPGSITGSRCQPEQDGPASGSRSQKALVANEYKKEVLHIKPEVHRNPFTFTVKGKQSRRSHTGFCLCSSLPRTLIQTLFFLHILSRKGK